LTNVQILQALNVNVQKTKWQKLRVHAVSHLEVFHYDDFTSLRPNQSSVDKRVMMYPWPSPHLI